VRVAIGFLYVREAAENVADVVLEPRRALCPLRPIAYVNASKVRIG
jgi:hypothetical protein